MPCCMTIAPTRKLISAMIGTLRSEYISRWWATEVQRQRDAVRAEADPHHDDLAKIVDDVDEIVAGVVDRLADRGQQRHQMSAHADRLRRLDRPVSRLLQQERVFGPRAAIGGLDPRSGQLRARAVDHPGAGGVHAVRRRRDR